MDKKEKRHQNYLKNREKILLQNKIWREQNKEKIKELDRRYYLENKEKHLEQCKQWRIQNKEKIKEQDHKYYVETKAHYLEQCKRWATDNKEKIREHEHQYYLENREKILEQNKIYYQKNKKHHLEQCKRWRLQNKEKIKESEHQKYLQNKEKILAMNKRWQINNADFYRSQQKIYRRTERKKYPHVRILESLRARLSAALKSANAYKTNHTMELVGCSIQFLVKYLESQFDDEMSWTNYGITGWHVDHKKACSTFDLTKIEEQKKCFHYTNLQPLWWEDNISKGNKSDYTMVMENLKKAYNVEEAFDA